MHCQHLKFWGLCHEKRSWKVRKETWGVWPPGDKGTRGRSLRASAFMFKKGKEYDKA